MSEAVEKVKQAVKPQQHFKSITIEHVYHYSFIEYITQYLLSFQIVNSIYKSFVLPLIDFVNVNIFSVSPIFDLLSFVDQLVNSGLVTFDKYILEIPVQTINSFCKTYVTPVENKLINLNNKYLNTAIEVKTRSEGEFYKVVETVQQVLINLKNFTFNKSIEIQQDLVATYNKELQSTDPKGNLIGKNLQASYNTASKTINKLNDDYLTPLKNQTQDYVDQFATQTKQRADEFINDAKQKVSPKLNELKESAPIVSASA